MTYPNRTKTQQACLKLGQDLWHTYNVATLKRLLIEQGQFKVAELLTTIQESAQHRARLEYEAERKRLDPSWEPKESDNV